MPRKKRPSPPVFKPYHQRQKLLLPPDIEELIPPDHLVRVVDRTIDQMGVEPLLSTYKGGGTSSYHPQMMLKVIIYGYLDRTFSVRQLAKQIRENVVYMWLTGLARPDYRTLNDFRKNRLRGCIDEVFGALMEMLVAEGYVDMRHYFVDGTKLAAAANRHTAVWAKNTQRYKEMIRQQVSELLKRVEAINEAEEVAYGGKDLAELGRGAGISSERIAGVVKEIDRKLQAPGQEQEEQATPEEPAEKALPLLDQPALGPSGGRSGEDPPAEADGEAGGGAGPGARGGEAGCAPLSRRAEKEMKQIRKKLADQLLPRLRRYEAQAEQFQGRNSYSKTEPEATFLRLKDGRLLPAYTVMVGTAGQYVLNYSIHQSASESREFIPHLEKLFTLTGFYPEAVIGDSAYGSEGNYEYVRGLGIGNYLKYNLFHYDEKGKKPAGPFIRDHFKYDEAKDEFECPQGRRLRYKGRERMARGNSAGREYRVYESVGCRRCPLAELCLRKPGAGPRQVWYSPKWEQYRQEAFRNLTSETGQELRRRRRTDVETVFGDIKQNMGYHRFRVKGKQGTNVEMGLLCLAHNMKKMHRRAQ